MALSTFTSNMLSAPARCAGVATSSRPMRLSVRMAASGTAQPKSSKPSFCAGLPGNTAPMGDFDPLNFTKGKDENTLIRYREAEITHGRVAMMASVGFIVGENFNPLFDESIKGPAIGHFQQLPPTFWVLVLAAVGGFEYGRATQGWVSPADGKGLFLLKEGYVPGAIGWDPLGLKPEDPAELAVMQTKELNHGRLAMFAIMGEIVQELVTGQELFNLEDDKILNDANCDPTNILCDILEKSG